MLYLIQLDVYKRQDPENMYVRKLSRNATAAQAEEKKIPDNYIEYYI